MTRVHEVAWNLANLNPAADVATHRHVQRATLVDVVRSSAVGEEAAAGPLLLVRPQRAKTAIDFVIWAALTRSDTTKAVIRYGHVQFAST